MNSGGTQTFSALQPSLTVNAEVGRAGPGGVSPPSSTVCRLPQSGALHVNPDPCSSSSGGDGYKVDPANTDAKARVKGCGGRITTEGTGDLCRAGSRSGVLGARYDFGVAYVYYCTHRVAALWGVGRLEF